MVRSVRIRHHNFGGHVGVLHIVSGGASLPVVVGLVVYFELVDNQTVPFDRCEGELGKLVAVVAAHGDGGDFDVILVALDGPGAVVGVDELLNLKREADEPLIAVGTYFELGVRILVPGMTFDPFAVAYRNTVAPVS